MSEAAPSDIIDAILRGETRTARGGVILGHVTELVASARRSQWIADEGNSAELAAALDAITRGDDAEARAALGRVPLQQLVEWTPTGPLVESLPDRIY